MSAPPPPSYESVVLNAAHYPSAKPVVQPPPRDLGVLSMSPDFSDPARRHLRSPPPPPEPYPPSGQPVVARPAGVYADLQSSLHGNPAETAAGARKAYWFKVWLSDPVKHGDSYTGYTLYRVATKTDAPDYALDADAFVLRRFSDFEWLHLALRTKLPGVIPPSLPEKTTSKRFDSDVVTQRMQELERFINKVANNAIMQTSSDLKMFLCESNPAAWEARAAWYEKGTMGHMVSSMSSWFNQMAVTAEGVYFSKGIQSVIKAEDPEYLDMVDYFVNLEGRLLMIRDCVARLSRSYITMGSLWGEFGAHAVAVGAADDDGAADALRDGTGDGLGKGLLQIGDAAASLKIPWERQTKDMMQHLLDRLRNYLGVVLTVKEAIDERANALIEYQTACCIYEDKVKAMQSLVQRAAGGQHPSAPKSDQVRTHESEVAAAAARRDDSKHRYDAICLRMKTELPLTYATMTKDINEAFDTFLETHAKLASQTARVWDQVLPGCGQIQLMPNVQPIAETDDVLTSDIMTSTYHSGLTAMGYTE
mmetsp:Transcript_44504/g.85125  ORF Transcript_44504/g.85125 Transcript_44504/m.85125 type:complete len:535 (+) Transcript_44504:274-1878(+)|eukprot:CAMPEP_0114233666 /NCGR_PEP_ID=MMETSP0058-20121206/5298_1 /TAXON_ID=36894 /ORGANISM="Pyramimonas parkeae, CCMP726" /LENGTH=534 /DNA_ID=CAMNT_0001345295 /DNA_START=267 /DNA_END=1871 /DNA_ORIENTATION=+